MLADRPWEVGAGVLKVLSRLSGQVLQSRHEEDLLETVAGTLREYVGADAVFIRLVECRIETRAVASAAGVQVLASGDLSAPFTKEDEVFWRAHLDGYFCRDVATSKAIKPEFRPSVLALGLRSGYAVPVIRDGEICGQVIYAWKSVPQLTDVHRAVLRDLADFACLQLTFFHLGKGSELDPMTGFPNWYGLQRRWELVGGERRGAIVFLEIGNWRAVADAHGRLGADDFVRALARLVLGLVGPRAVIGRFDNDAFVLLGPGMSAAEVAQLVSDIKRRFDAATAHTPHPRPYLTIGTSYWPQHGKDLRALVTTAEQKAHRKKRHRIELAMTTQLDLTQGRLPRPILTGWMTATIDGVIITDADLKVIYVNPAYENMTGYSLEEWLDKTPAFVASGKTPLKVYENMWESLSSHGTWTGQVVNRRRSGEEWVAYLTITRLMDRTGRTIGFLGISRDIERLKEDERLSEPSRVVFEDVFAKEGLTWALAEAAELLAGGSREHLERVRQHTRLLMAVGAREGIEEFQSYRFRSAVTLAAVLHDVGNLVMPREILRKRGHLSPHEYEVIKNHTVAGRELLSTPALHGGVPVPSTFFLQTAAAVAGSHHERWDGTGYPDGLAGAEIPLAARVVAIADVYDVLRSERPYRSALSHAEAVAYVKSQAGKHFDPRLVELFSFISDAFDEVVARLPDRPRASHARAQRGSLPPAASNPR